MKKWLLITLVCLGCQKFPKENILETNLFFFYPKEEWVKISPLSDELPIYRTPHGENITFKILPKETTKEVILSPQVEAFYIANHSTIFSKKELDNNWIDFVLQKTTKENKVEEIDLYHINPNYPTVGGFLVHLSGKKSLKELEGIILSNITITQPTRPWNY